MTTQQGNGATKKAIEVDSRQFLAAVGRLAGVPVTETLSFPLGATFTVPNSDDLIGFIAPRIEKASVGNTPNFRQGKNLPELVVDGARFLAEHLADSVKIEPRRAFVHALRYLSSACLIAPNQMMSWGAYLVQSLALEAYIAEIKKVNAGVMSTESFTGNYRGVAARFEQSKTAVVAIGAILAKPEHLQLVALYQAPATLYFDKSTWETLKGMEPTMCGNVLLNLRRIAAAKGVQTITPEILWQAQQVTISNEEILGLAGDGFSPKQAYEAYGVHLTGARPNGTSFSLEDLNPQVLGEIFAGAIGSADISVSTPENGGPLNFQIQLHGGGTPDIEAEPITVGNLRAFGQQTGYGQSAGTANA